jgi:hypothetical protein
MRGMMDKTKQSIWIDERTGLPVHYHEKHYGNDTFCYKPCDCGNNAFDRPASASVNIGYYKPIFETQLSILRDDEFKFIAYQHQTGECNNES